MEMANFAVNTSDEIIARGKTLLERLSQPGERQGDTLGRIFGIVEAQIEGETIKAGGVDVEALDSALAAIRTQFLAAVKGKEQIASEMQRKLDAVRAAKEQTETDLRAALEVAKTAQTEAETKALAATQEASQTAREAQDTREKAEVLKALLAEKEKAIAALTAQIEDARDKANRYESIKERAEVAERTIENLKRDAELEKLKALMKAEKEIARLTGRIESLEAQAKKETTPDE